MGSSFTKLVGLDFQNGEDLSEGHSSKYLVVYLCELGLCLQNEANISKYYSCVSTCVIDASFFSLVIILMSLGSVPTVILLCILVNRSFFPFFFF